MGDDHDLRAPTDRQRFLQALPWYVNGTLDAQERSWVEAMLGASAWARSEHALALEISRATRAQLNDVPELPVAELLRRVRAAQPRVEPRPAAPTRRPPAWLEGLASAMRSSITFIARPSFAMGLLAVVVLQTATLGWFALRGADDSEGSRSWAPHGAASIRVRAAPAVSEVQIREALLAAGVTIVQGPNELGEYIVRPTGVKSLDEAEAALRIGTAFGSVEVMR
jgi:hypothetical protein